MDTPTLVVANRRDPTHPYGYGEVLAREIPEAGLGEVTLKPVSEERHATDLRAAIGDFLARRCSLVAGEGEKRE